VKASFYASKMAFGDQLCRWSFAFSTWSSSPPDPFDFFSSNPFIVASFLSYLLWWVLGFSPGFPLFSFDWEVGSWIGVESLGFDMVATQRLQLSLCKRRRGLGFLFQIAVGWWVVLLLVNPVAGLRPLRERTRSWDDEVCLGACL